MRVCGFRAGGERCEHDRVQLGAPLPQQEAPAYEYLEGGGSNQVLHPVQTYCNKCFFNRFVFLTWHLNFKDCLLVVKDVLCIYSFKYSKIHAVRITNYY